MKFQYIATNKKFQKASAPILLDLKKYSSYFPCQKIILSLITICVLFNSPENFQTLRKKKVAKVFGSLKNIS